CRKTFPNQSGNSKCRKREAQYGRHLLGLFWEHPPPLNPEAVGRAMQQIRDRISGLEDRRGALLEEKQALIVEGAIRNRRGNGNNGGN
ncbi:hypothetical protein Leryth_025490, partial [Lithospermum erythrorhizon]